jgi:Spherulation-specific family 4
VCLKCLVPAYFYKSTPWATLASTTQPLVIIANASNGPGTTRDSTYYGWLDAARAAGHRVMGYVYSGWGGRATASVLADMDAWTQLYGVADYFVDEASALQTDVAYYRQLLNTAVSTAPTRTFMLNPGTPPVNDYFTLRPGIDILVFEHAWSGYTATTLPARLDAVASQCWIMALSASETDMNQAAAVARSRRFAGYFGTDVSFTAGLPSYWANEKALAVCA